MSRKGLVTVELSSSELAALAAYAKAEKRTKSNAARRLIVLALDSEYFAGTPLERKKRARGGK